MQPLVEKYLKKHPELQTEQPIAPEKEGMTWRQVILLNWGFWSVIAGIWVADGNPKEGFLYCAFWGFVIASATIMMLAGCFARIWLAYHTPEIATNIYRGLSRR